MTRSVLLSPFLIAVILLCTPINSTRFPVFPGLNFGGNQTVSNDAGVFIVSGWVSSRQKGAIGNRTEA